MKNFLFDVEVEKEENYNSKLLLVKAQTQEDAQTLANYEMVSWWGRPVDMGDIGDHWVWKMYDGAEVPGKPKCSGEFTDAEVAVVRRSTNDIGTVCNSPESVIGCLQDAIGDGMRVPPDKMLIDLFGEAFAARCKVELEA